MSYPSLFSTIITERLTIREFRCGSSDDSGTSVDLQRFVHYRNNPDVAKHQSWDSYDLRKATALFQRQSETAFGAEGSWHQIALADRHTDQLIGDVALHFCCDQQIEIGFTIGNHNYHSHSNTNSDSDSNVDSGNTLAVLCGENYQQQGYAKEALSAVLPVLFENWGVHRVTATVDVLNAASVRLLEALHFRREGTYLENVWFKGSWGSEHSYALLAREFVADKIEK